MREKIAGVMVATGVLLLGAAVLTAVSAALWFLAKEALVYANPAAFGFLAILVGLALIVIGAGCAEEDD